MVQLDTKSAISAITTRWNDTGIEISADGITHKAKMIRTHSKGKTPVTPYIQVLELFQTRFPSSTLTHECRSVLPHHNMALWEGGGKSILILETRGIHHEYTAGVPFSAHPRIEPDGTPGISAIRSKIDRTI